MVHTFHANNGRVAGRFYKELFFKVPVQSNPELLASILRRVEAEANTEPCSRISEAELWTALNTLDLDSGASPNGFNGRFYHTCSGTIKKDLVEAGNAFLEGLHYPKAMANSLLVLIPKIPNPVHFSDYRPISLCTLFNKLISKVLAQHMAMLLPELISKEQSSFV
ncbi:uncharacterized protein M6B38_182225 [Iris pallida]|uniref:Reverse transcriptase domain-containing protein n=1 Tax=Iris pallida TaxID=29817 RepID=A0AAX6EM49_IRIPA|nr:uncharacterized protein M6B38_182225 [Iris pallida]